jgi:hypothetical protein
MTTTRKPYTDKKFKSVFGVSKQQFLSEFDRLYASTTMTTIGTLPSKQKVEKKKK